MDFYTVLDQVIELLRRRGRVTYGALKLQFGLDNEQLEVLKDEIIAAQRLARDEEGRILVWIGDAQAVTAQGAQAPQPPTPQGQSSSQAAPPPEAERRQLTVMFCDLVDSTKLSSQLDPEEYREVVRAYQATCTEVIQRYDGHIAQLLGDGLLVYLGYPQAHEDDAQRAIRAGLGILEAVKALNARLEPAKGITLAVRLGLHTGLVVVGEMGGAGRQEQLALGETPNIAARIQGLAEPDTLLISSDTYRLIQGYFECQALGAQALRGVAEPIAVYRVLQESEARGRLDVAVTRGLTPLVGREQEVGLLLDRWEQAKAGHGQVVLLSGDAGIGKSRLVQMLKDHVADEPHMRWECRSSAYSQNTALYPVTDLIQRALHWQQEDTPAVRLQKLEQALHPYRLPLEESVPLCATWLALPVPEDRYPPLLLSPQRYRQKTLEILLTMVLEQAERHPVLFILEDLHWTDPTTLEFLDLLIDQTPTASLYALLTCRPTFQPSWHHRSYLTEVTVSRLSLEQITRMASHVAGGKRLPAEVLQQIVAKTDGVPLFVEEVVKVILESGYLQEVNGGYDLEGTVPSFAIPATLHDSLMARLDRLVSARSLAQLGAVIGRQFSYDVLQAVLQLDDVILQRELGKLVEAELVYQRGLPPQATYLFKHALIQDAAYQSLLKSTRQQYHQRIAQVLEAQFPATVDQQPELLAYHYTEAGLTEKAVHYWHHAGQKAIERSAHVEAITHLRQGLALLQTLPETPDRVPREVDMLIALGASLRAMHGTGAVEVGETYTRARQLCEHLENPYQLFPILRGLWNYYQVRAEHQAAYALGEQLLILAQQVQDAAMLIAARRALGSTLFFLGAVAAAHTHFAQGIALYDLQQHRAYAFRYGEDTGVACRSYDAWTLWFLGYPHQGLTQIDEMVTLAQQMAHPYSLSFGLLGASLFSAFRREVRAVQGYAEAAITLATEQGFPYWMAMGTILRGWTLAQQGQAQDGIEQLQQGLRAFCATGAELWRPYFLALLAEAYGTIEQPETGLTALAEALTLMDTTGERVWEPSNSRFILKILYDLCRQTLLERIACPRSRV
jgi:class 3 adenylate cyclase/predicted ATPase